MDNNKKIRKASENELDKVMKFYNDVISNTTDMEKYARWKKDLHPTRQSVKEYIMQGAMYVLDYDGQASKHIVCDDAQKKGNQSGIAGAMAITMSQKEDYHAISWKMALEDDEVSVIHILAVNPDLKGQGIGKKMIDEAIKLSKEMGKKAVRLDALASNTPAHHLYEGMGFVYRGKQNLYADNTGWTDFFYYDMQL